MFWLMMIGHLLVIYMVYAVVRYGKGTNKKFDDGFWYLDRPNKRDW